MAGTADARKYKPSTVKRLHALSGNQCAAPHCQHMFVARDGETLISKICHIEAASPEGPRWNAKMTDEERRHFNNLILLCDECHSIIDNKVNESQYPVELLRQWKKEHESTMTYSYLNGRPSLLSTVITAISEIEMDAADEGSRMAIEAFTIEDKISYNDVKRNRALLDEYKVFYHKINSLYQTLEAEGSFKKENLLRNIRRVYLAVKGTYVGDASEPMKIVRANADNIVEDVQEKLIRLAEGNARNCTEDISFGVSVIMVDAFMRCKILEAPPAK